MTLVRLFRSLENPAVPVTASTLLGLGTDPPALTERQLLGVSAWFRGVTMTASTLAGLPLHFYRRGSFEKVKTPAVFDLNTGPNPAQTPFEFWFTQVGNAINWGNCFAWKVRNQVDEVRELWPLHPSKVSVRAVKPTAGNPSGKLFRVVGPDGGSREYTDQDIFHIPYLSLTGVEGVPVLSLVRQSMGVTIGAERTAARFYENGARLSGILQAKEKISQAKAEEWKAQFRARYMGADSAGEVAVLDQGSEFKPMALPPADAELLVSRQFGVKEVSRWLGIPPHMLGDVETSTSWGTGIEQQVLGWVKFTLAGWIKLIEQRVTREILRGQSQYARFSVEGLLRGDSKSRAEFYTAGIRMGWLSRARVQELEDTEPDPQLETYLYPKELAEVGGGQLDRSAALAAIVQKLYRGKDVVVSAEEARAFLADAGFPLDPTTDLTEFDRPGTPGATGGPDDE